MRSLSTGSALLNVIRGGVGRSSSGVSRSTMTDSVLLVMKELSPRLWAGHSLHLFESDVTVLLSRFPGTSGDSLVKTTCLVLAGPERLQRLTEYWTAWDCRALQ